MLSLLKYLDASRERRARKQKQEVIKSIPVRSLVVQRIRAISLSASVLDHPPPLAAPASCLEAPPICNHPSCGHAVVLNLHQLHRGFICHSKACRNINNHFSHLKQRQP